MRGVYCIKYTVFTSILHASVRTRQTRVADSYYNCNLYMCITVYQTIGCPCLAPVCALER